MTIHRHLTKSSVVPLIVILAAVGAIVYIYPQSPGLTGKDRPGPEKKISEAPEIFLTGIHQTTFEHGRKKWALAADSARLVRREDTTIMQNLAMTLYGKEKKSARVTAKKGVFSMATGNAEISGNVTLKSDPYEITTRSLQYRKKSNILVSRNPVDIQSDFLSFEGNRLVYDVSRNQAVLKDDVHGVVENPPKNSS